jgi:hypothetical protein
VAEPAAQRTPLDLLPGAVLRARALRASVIGVVIGAVLGVVVGLLAGWPAGLVVGVCFGLPMPVLAVAEARRRFWLADGVVSVRALGTRSVDLRQATGLELLVTELRGSTTVGVLVSGPPRGKTVNVAVAMYTDEGGRELDVLALRRLADALAGNADADGLVFAELLVAQLRAEARGAALAERPLYRIATAAPGRRLTQRLRPDAVGRFVATLD